MRHARLLLFLAQLVLIPAVAWGTGTLSIPNVIGAQSGPNVAASLFDANWNQIRDYVNNREITIGTLAARPAASVAGRYYLASDTNGGTYYVDTGVTWTQVAPGVSAAGGAYAVRNLVAATASATNTSVNMTADVVVLRSPSDGSLVAQRATVSRTNVTITAGPAADARDRAAAFSVSTWIHFYYIWNGTTLSTLSSTCAPADATGGCSASTGPVLPSTYTHWAYVGPMYLRSDGTLAGSAIRGSRVYYASTSMVNAFSTQAPVVETTQSVATLIPPNALTGLYLGRCTTTAGSAATDTCLVRNVTGINYTIIANPGASVGGQDTQMFEMPNLGQSLYYLVVTTGTAPNLTLSVLGYRIPNGGE